MKSVCRHKKAGVWITSTTWDTASISLMSWTSVRIGTPTCFFTLARISKPFSIPRPRNEAPEERLALSNEDLYINGIFKALVISFNWPATSIADCSDSITHVPAIKNNGWSRPISKPHSLKALIVPLMQLVSKQHFGVPMLRRWMPKTMDVRHEGWKWTPGETELQRTMDASTLGIPSFKATTHLVSELK